MSYQMGKEETTFEPLTISRSNYKKCLVEKNEIFYLGKMYDIKTRIFSGDSVDMMVIQDVEEGKILKKLNKLLSHTQEKMPDTILLLLSLNYLPLFSLNSNIVFTCSTQKQFQFSEALIMCISDVLSPPPKPV